MKDYLYPLVLVVLGTLALVMATKASEHEKREIRRIALEEACRTIVEAGLVKSCTLK